MGIFGGRYMMIKRRALVTSRHLAIWSVVCFVHASVLVICSLSLSVCSLIFGGNVFSYAQVLSGSSDLTYPMCTDFDSLHEKYNFCPRIEGQYPKGCCPAIKGSRKQCYYAEYRITGDKTLVNSSYQVCENGLRM